MSACLYTPSFHDEIFNFTGVERTNSEIYVHLFDNANVYMTIIKGSFTVSVKHKIQYIAKHMMMYT